MNIDDREIVPAIRRALADRIGAERYDLWFAASTQFRSSGDRLCVVTASTFLQDWLRTTFRADLEAAAQEVLGRAAAVVFEVGTVTAGEAAPVTTPNAEPTSHTTQSSDDDRPTVFKLVGCEPATTDAPRRRVTAAPPAYDFDGFVVGASNRLAYASSLGAAERLGSISPLLLHGSTGVGKTHLLEALTTFARRRNSEIRAAYLTAEQFTTEFLEALNGRGLPNFRRKFRDLHLLVVDDVQFFAGKRATLVEAVHTLDALQRAGRQVVFAADRPPAELGCLGPEFCSRLSAGLACGIEPPEADVRDGIVRRMAVALGLSLPDDVRRFVTTHFTAHARELAGALKRLLAAERAYGRAIDPALAEEALGELARGRRKSVLLADIDRAVCNHFGLADDALQSSRKGKEIVQPRMLAMWLARKYTRSALSEIGGYFGGRRHSTVISAAKQVDDWLANGRHLRLHGETCPSDEAIRKIEATLMGATG